MKESENLFQKNTATIEDYERSKKEVATLEDRVVALLREVCPKNESDWKGLSKLPMWHSLVTELNGKSEELHRIRFYKLPFDVEKKLDQEEFGGFSGPVRKIKRVKLRADKAALNAANKEVDFWNDLGLSYERAFGNNSKVYDLIIERKGQAGDNRWKVEEAYDMAKGTEKPLYTLADYEEELRWDSGIRGNNPGAEARKHREHLQRLKEIESYLKRRGLLSSKKQRTEKG